MYRTAAAVNRTGLIVVGLLLLLAGSTATSIGLGGWQPLTAALGLGQLPPGPTDTVVGPAVAGAFGPVWVAAVVGVAGIVLALVGLRWLIAQIPRRDQAKPFRLHDDPATGLTRCAPDVLTAAVEAQVTALPGVHRATAVLRGTAGRPDLTVRVTVGDRTDVPRLLAALRDQVAADLGQALDTRVRRLGVLLEVDPAKPQGGQITR